MNKPMKNLIQDSRRLTDIRTRDLLNTKQKSEPLGGNIQPSGWETRIACIILVLKSLGKHPLKLRRKWMSLFQLDSEINCGESNGLTHSKLDVNISFGDSGVEFWG
jgi:hypothetical protein